MKLRLPGAESKVAPERRHHLPLPAEALRERPFIYDSHTRRLICPWGRQQSTLTTETMLEAVCCVLVNGGTDFGVWWVWHDGRPASPVQAADLHGWLAHWARDRATYRLDPTAQEAAGRRPGDRVVRVR